MQQDTTFDPGSAIGRREKPRLSFWEIWNMSFGFLGIQFGFGLQNANVSRIFQSLGASMDDIPILWVAAPVTGLLVQPLIGYFSDRTWHPRWGRRRPYFLVGAILASIALCLMPNSPALWIAAGMLWIMDASINISMEPFRAFVGDNLPASQRTRGFAMQSFFIGIGAVVASALPWMLTNWLGIPNEPGPGEKIPPNIYWAFYIGGAVFFSAVLWTVLKSKEYSPEELAQFDENKEEEYEREQTPEEYAKNGRAQMRSGVIVMLIGAALTFWITTREDLPKDLYIFTVGVGAAGLIAFASGWLQQRGKYKNGFVTIVNDFQYMPTTMKQLAVVQFFSWFALFSMWIYTTAAVTSHLYGTTDTTSKIYNDGADMVGVWFGVYNGVAALVAFLIPIVAKKITRRVTHMFCLTLGGLGLLSIYFVPDPIWVYASMVGVGIAWSSILSVPYAMLAGALPADKMGYYMGVFNFFIVIPQLVAAALLGFMVKYFFNSEPIYALIIGGISMILAGLLSLRVDDKDEATA
jgi:maltose/moltooligosaccharide transporter